MPVSRCSAATLTPRRPTRMRIDAETLLYEFTVDDPKTFTQPLTAAIPMKSSDAPLFEYACHEGNYGMTNLLTEARAVQAQADGGT